MEWAKTEYFRSDLVSFPQFFFEAPWLPVESLIYVLARARNRNSQKSVKNAVVIAHMLV
jgi:hypothetical protein